MHHHPTSPPLPPLLPLSVIDQRPRRQLAQRRRHNGRRFRWLDESNVPVSVKCAISVPSLVAIGAYLGAPGAANVEIGSNSGCVKGLVWMMMHVRPLERVISDGS